MDLDNLLATFPAKVRESPSLKGMVILIQTLSKQLSKSQEKIRVLEEELCRLQKTSKRPKFRPNGMLPRDRSNESPGSPDPFTPAVSASLVQKEVSEISCYAVKA